MTILPPHVDSAIAADSVAVTGPVTGRPTAGRALRAMRLIGSDGQLVAGVVLLLILILASLVAPAIFGLTQKAQAVTPHVLAAPSGAHWLGTDSVGRDILARTMVGIRSSLLVALVATFIIMVLGSALGILSGYRGGKADWLFMRFADILLGIPSLLLGIALLSALSPSVKSLILVLVVGYLPLALRVVRAAALETRHREYITSAQISGVAPARIMTRHVFPNIRSTIFAQASITVAHMLLIAASLSFLGLGLQPPTPDLGYMVSESQQWMQQAPWTALAPGTAILVCVMCFTLLGTGLDNALAKRQ